MPSNRYLQRCAGHRFYYRSIVGIVENNSYLSSYSCPVFEDEMITFVMNYNQHEYISDSLNLNPQTLIKKTQIMVLCVTVSL